MAEQGNGPDDEDDELAIQAVNPVEANVIIHDGAANSTAGQSVVDGRKDAANPVQQGVVVPDPVDGITVAPELGDGMGDEGYEGAKQAVDHVKSDVNIQDRAANSTAGQSEVDGRKDAVRKGAVAPDPLDGIRVFAPAAVSESGLAGEIENRPLEGDEGQDKVLAGAVGSGGKVEFSDDVVGAAGGAGAVGSHQSVASAEGNKSSQGPPSGSKTDEDAEIFAKRLSGLRGSFRYDRTSRGLQILPTPSPQPLRLSSSSYCSATYSLLQELPARTKESPSCSWPNNSWAESESAGMRYTCHGI